MDGTLDPAATLLDAIAATDAGRIDLAVADTSRVEPEAAGGVVSRERFVLFSIASTHYAVPASFVTELERVPKVTAVPRVPAWIRGVTNLRGDILSVIDMRTFLGLDAMPPHSGRMLVVRLLDEEFSAGLVVDAVERIVAVPPEEIRPPASPLKGPLIAYLSGVCVIGDRVVAVLDLDRLLRSTDIRQFDEPKEVEVGA